jgi:hypothetical protein
VQPDARRKLSRLVEEKRAHHFPHIIAQFFPSVSLGNDRFRKALRAIAAVRFLDDFKNKFVHSLALNIPLCAVQQV